MTMHCPLCKAQYAAGYDLCRGCDADLVFTKQQADAEDVVLLLESANLTGVGELAKALKEANVPNYLRFADGKAKAPVIGLFAQGNAVKEQSWQIFVLGSDLERARQVAFAARFAGRHPEPGDRRSRLARFLPVKLLTSRAS
jgi:hypothetical protein